MEQVVVRLLPDGSGRVCLHWIYEDKDGPIETVDSVVQTSAGPKLLGARRWRMACCPQLTNIDPKREGVRIIPWQRSDDPRAVTCPRCMATDEFKARMEFLGTIPAGTAGASAAETVTSTFEEPAERPATAASGTKPRTAAR